jgi:polyhydroxybutyrate depolymerase
MLNKLYPAVCAKKAGLSLIFTIFLISMDVQLSAQTTFQFSHEGLDRSYILYMPQNLPDDAPLVFVLHGYTSGANIIMSYCEMNDVADQNKFAVCYPQGLGDNFGIPHWNANLSISTINDIGFLSELAVYL